MKKYLYGEGFPVGFFVIILLWAVLVIGTHTVSLAIMSEEGQEVKVVVTVTGKYIVGKNNDQTAIEINWTDPETGNPCGKILKVSGSEFALAREGDKHKATVQEYKEKSIFGVMDEGYNINLGDKLP